MIFAQSLRSPIVWFWDIKNGIIPVGCDSSYPKTALAILCSVVLRQAASQSPSWLEARLPKTALSAAARCYGASLVASSMPVSAGTAPRSAHGREARGRKSVPNGRRGTKKCARQGGAAPKRGPGREGGRPGGGVPSSTVAELAFGAARASALSSTYNVCQRICTWAACTRSSVRSRKGTA